MNVKWFLVMYITGLAKEDGDNMKKRTKVELVKLTRKVSPMFKAEVRVIISSKGPKDGIVSFF